jgi:phosphopantothenoylcysteine decarboxylase/phosphopantothenate--cysteine ligase
VATAEEMRSAVLRLFDNEGFDYYVSAAAISDFAPARLEGKIPSGSPTALTLHPLPKLLPEVVSRHHPTTVAFKLGWDEEPAAHAMLEQGIRMVIVNTPAVMGAGEGEFTLFTADGEERIQGTKEEVATAIWDRLR